MKRGKDSPNTAAEGWKDRRSGRLLGSVSASEGTNQTVVPYFWTRSDASRSEGNRRPVGSVFSISSMRDGRHSDTATWGVLEGIVERQQFPIAKNVWKRAPVTLKGVESHVRES